MTSIEWLKKELQKGWTDEEIDYIFMLFKKSKEMNVSEKPTDHKDKIVQQVIDKFNQRSEVGIKKYGTTLEQNNNDDYFTHLQEELMDAILYIEKLKSIKYANR